MLNWQSMVNRFFRASIGTVVYNDNNDVAFFERLQHPEGIWQFQQGGIDIGEHFEEALWREVQEEIGLLKENFDVITEREGWTLYEDAPALHDKTIVRLGQVHHWYFLKLKSDIEIDLSKATDNEFKNWKWVTFDEAVSLTNPNKQHVYKMLQEFFLEHLAT